MISQKKYIQDFTCLAEKCPDHCCQGWNISLQAVDVHNLHCAGFGHIVDIQLAQVSSQKACQITLKNRSCGAMIDGRCGVQMRSGHENIPLICASYPRAFYRYSSKENPLAASKMHQDVHGFLSCPEIARNIWMGEGKDWISMSEESQYTSRLKVAEDFTSSGLYARKCSYIRNAVQLLLYSTTHSLLQKMMIMATGVRLSPAFFHHSSTKDEAHRIVDELQRNALVAEPDFIESDIDMTKLRQELFEILYAVYKNPPPVSYKKSLEVHQKAVLWLEQNYVQWSDCDHEMFQQHQNGLVNLYEYDWMERPYMLFSNLAEHELANQIRQNLLRLYLISQPTENISVLISSMERLLSHSVWLQEIIQKLMRRSLPITHQLFSFYL